MSRYELFDRSRIELAELAERGHDLGWQQCRPLRPPAAPYEHPELESLVERVRAARRSQRPVILFLGAHAIKLGLSRFLVDLIERRIVTHVATNGAGMIHDFELAAFGGTSEDVARWIRTGQFGLWRETGRINERVREAAERGEGLGEALGRTLVEQRAPHADLSLAAAGWRGGIPVTCHVGIGSDILHAHPNCDGAAVGRASYTDFLIYARSVEELEGGVVLNLGTAVTGPEVFLKALSMARNVARQQGREIRRFSTAVVDLVPLPDDFRQGPPGKDHALYYYRPWKTLLVRTVQEGGESYYFRGDLGAVVPTLWARLTSG